MIRKPGVPKRADDQVDPANPWTHFRAAIVGRGARRRRRGPAVDPRPRRRGTPWPGFGSAKGSNEEAYLFQKLVRTGFGSNNVDHCTRLCHASSVAALMETIGSGAVTAPFSECRNSDVIIVIGANPTVNHPVAATFIKNAAKPGAKLIVMDPRGQALSRHAAYHLAFRPGTDVALLNALIHVIIAREPVRPGLRRAVHRGVRRAAPRGSRPFTPEAMAPVCGIDAETLREVARTYATAQAAMIFWGMGISQHVHGTDNARCLIALALIAARSAGPGRACTRSAGRTTSRGRPTPA